MSNEHTQHRQCQTCFVDFPTNQELVNHIEEYRFRERLLVAELEQCRMHIAQPPDPDDDDAADNGDRDEEGEFVSHRCPFPACERKESFSTRSNLVRHFQAHVQCFEMCPFCNEIMRQVHRFIRHDCKSYPDQSKNIYIQHRISQLNGVVTKELDRLQSLRSENRKRECGAADSDLMRPPKRVKATGGAIALTTTSSQSNLTVGCSMGTYDTISTHDNPWVAADNAGLPPSLETVTNVPTSDGEWAFAETSADATDDGGWAFATSIPTDDGGWAFAETTATESAELACAEPSTSAALDGGMAFPAIMSSNSGDLTYTPQLGINHAGNDGNGLSQAQSFDQGFYTLFSATVMH